MYWTGWGERWRERNNDSGMSVYFMDWYDQLPFDYNLLLLSAIAALLCYWKVIPGQWTLSDYMYIHWSLGLYLPLRRGRVFLTDHGSGGQPNTGGCLKVDKVRLPPSTKPCRNTFPQHPLPPSPGDPKHNGRLVPQKEFCKCQPCKHHPSLLVL